MDARHPQAEACAFSGLTIAIAKSPLRLVAKHSKLSRLNREYPGKKISGTFVLHFFNDSEEIFESFRPYCQIAELTGVSDPQMVYDLFEKLRVSSVFKNSASSPETCGLYLEKLTLKRVRLTWINVVLSHYRLSKIKRQNLKLAGYAQDYGLEPSEGARSAKAAWRHDGCDYWCQECE